MLQCVCGVPLSVNMALPLFVFLLTVDACSIWAMVVTGPSWRRSEQWQEGMGVLWGYFVWGTVKPEYSTITVGNLLKWGLNQGWVLEKDDSTTHLIVFHKIIFQFHYTDGRDFHPWSATSLPSLSCCSLKRPSNSGFWKGVRGPKCVGGTAKITHIPIIHGNPPVDPS